MVFKVGDYVRFNAKTFKVGKGRGKEDRLIGGNVNDIFIIKGNDATSCHVVFNLKNEKVLLSYYNETLGKRRTIDEFGKEWLIPATALELAKSRIRNEL